MIKTILSKLVRTRSHKSSYSQQGEDIVIDFLLEQLKIHQPFYLDIGANDPIRLSNSYYFYRKGGSGICVDPNLDYLKKYRIFRRRDKFLSLGLTGGQTKIVPYYRMSWPEFNTFDLEQAEEIQKNYKGANKIEKIVDQNIININEFLETYVKIESIDFLNLDVEGLDFEILKNWDFKKYRPKLICVEIRDLKTKSTNKKIIDLLWESGYKMISNNVVNGIFVNKEFNI